LALIISLLRSSYNMAFRDDLTGLLARRALNDRIKGLSKQYVIAMSDVDHFKKFNDTYGHDIGDEVLKLVAIKLDSVSGGGTAYRYGGEKFCMVFPGKTLNECEPFLEVVRKSVEDYKMAVRNTQYRPKSDEIAMERRGRRSKNREENLVSVTISIGAAESNAQNATPEDVLKAADRALYKAKEKGRNCLVLS
jgi:diguanylate cyclase (GGDEF)-like protein